MHLLVHYQNHDAHRVIRIIPVLDMAAYKAELLSVYKTAGDDDGIHMFFNVSDMITRLVSDIGFKSFKGCGKLEAVTENLFRVPSKAPADFFSAMFLPWAKDKIADYIADLDETSVINIETLKSSPLPPSEVAQFVHVQFEEGGTFYNLLNCHKTEDDNFVLSEQHLKALFMAYAKNNKSQFGPHRMEGGTFTCRKDADGQFIPYEPGEEHEEIVYECIRSVHEWPESYFSCSTDDKLKPFVNPKLVYVLSSFRFSNLNNGGPPVKIGDVLYGRGITVSKTALTNQDIDVLIEQLGITEALNKALFYLILKNDVVEFNEIEGYDGLYKMYAAVDDSLISTGMEYPYCPYATFIETESSLNVREPWDLEAVRSSRNATETDSNVRNVSNVEKSHTFYKDLITNSVRCFKHDIKFLPEFQRLGDVQCSNAVVIKIMESFVSDDALDIDRGVVTELMTLATLMSSFFPGENRSEDDDKNETVLETVRDRQYMATKDYVKLYKSDKDETIASTALEHVYNFLQSTKRLPEINKNRIGSDLVDLGVKKTRKTRGYVYGLEDVSRVVGPNDALAPLKESDQGLRPLFKS